MLVDFKQQQGDWSGGVKFAEEAYNLVVEAYDPVHPEVQEAAGILISSLTKCDNLFDAERYAEVTYMNLRDRKNGMDQEGEEIANGAYNLSNVIFQSDGDLSRAESLAREALRIRDIRNTLPDMIAMSCSLLAKILQMQRKFGDETKQLLERSLRLMISQEGPDGVNVSASDLNFSAFYSNLANTQSTVDLKREFLLLAKSYAEEGCRIEKKIHVSNHPNYVNATNKLTFLVSELSRV
jgi:hypothetical protein